MKPPSTTWVALAAFFWGLSGGIAGILVRDGWDPFVVALYRGAIGLALVLLWLALHPSQSGFARPRLWLWSIIAGLGVAGNFGFYFLSIEQGSVAVAATLMYCAPVFVYLASFVLKLERPTVLKWIAVSATILGVALLTGALLGPDANLTPLGVAAGLLSGLSYAIFIFGFKYASSHGSPPAILAIAFATLLAILVWPADRQQTIAVLTASSWPLFAALGIFGAGLSFFLYIVGLRNAAPAVASVVAAIEPVTAALFGIALLDESLSGPQLVGMGLILATVTVLSARSQAHQTPDSR